MPLHKLKLEDYQRILSSESSDEALAEQCSVTVTYIRQLRRGKVKPGILAAFEDGKIIDHSKFEVVNEVLTQPVIGFRFWNVTKDRDLKSYNSSFIWDAEPQVARCTAFRRERDRRVWVRGRKNAIMLPDDHPVPYWGCSCGFWFYKDLNQAAKTADLYALGQGRRVLGVGLCYGKIVEAQYGFRVEKAQIVAIIKVDKQPKTSFFNLPLLNTQTVSIKRIPTLQLVKEHKWYLSEFGQFLPILK